MKAHEIRVVRKLQFQNNFFRKNQNTKYFVRLVRQLTELSNKSIMFFLFCFTAILLSAQSNPFFEGTGGSGIRIAVLQPTGINIPEQEQWLLRLVQSTLTGDFNRYSAMTVIDRQNLETILGEQNQSLSGNYSERDFISIGNLTNARHILAGTLTKTGSGFLLELSVSDAQTGERKASFPPRNCSLDDLQSTAVIKQAEEELFAQMGVILTEVGKQALRDSVSAIPQVASGAATGVSDTVTTERGETLSFIDYLSRNADALYALGEIQDALSQYRRLTYFYPWYYKGWLGIVRCFSRNYTNFDFVDSEIFMERASITATGNAQKQEVQQVRAVFDAQWPAIAVKREQQAIEEAKRRQENFHRMTFRQQGGTLIEYNGSSEEVIIPPEITVIGDAAFRQNGRVKRVVLHNKITAIGRNAFANCRALVEIVIPESVTSIGAGAFNNCTSLVDIIIPGGITVIPDNAFSGCKSLRNVTISPGIQRIERSFVGCENLAEIIIPRSVTAIGDFAFSQCTNLKTVILLNDNVTIGRRAFMGCPLSNRDEMIRKFGATIFN
ncbi:MAG: leucine-rich repeat protein [Treponema sp.]|jgi:TolB-like protein|nr:leucine-rich repeat protein [Treponema sp.]